MSTSTRKEQLNEGSGITNYCYVCSGSTSTAIGCPAGNVQPLPDEANDGHYVINYLETLRKDNVEVVLGERSSGSRRVDVWMPPAWNILWMF